MESNGKEGTSQANNRERSLMEQQMHRSKRDY
jgi:hypothetical protein